jgi:hypothetical protein
MIRVHVICEGPTEEDFVRQVLLEPFIGRGIQLLPSCIGRIGHKGGRVNLDRLEFDVNNRFRDRHCYCTTLFDFYGLPAKFPGKAEAEAQTNVAGKQRAVIDALSSWAEGKWGRDTAARFIPYVQMHEFEALLFSAPEVFAKAIGDPGLAKSFQDIRSEFGTPEEINDDPNKAPSKRIKTLYEAYAKPSAPVLAAIEIGLDTIRRECQLFDAWLSRLESLASGSRS